MSSSPPEFISRTSRRGFPYPCSRAVSAAVALILCAVIAGCGADDGTSNPRSITVWSLENLPKRFQATKRIAAEFTRRTGIEVHLVAVSENQFNQLLISSAASGELPDVVGALSLSGLYKMHANKLLDARAASRVVDQLGQDTFSKRALELISSNGAQLGVPSDAWVQLLVYRKDLFKKAGLPPPKTYADIRHAAKVLSTDKRAGIVAATAANDVLTQQTFEYLALANDCHLVHKTGEVTLDAPRCVQAFGFYGDLIRNYSVAGAQDVESTRATYFAGESAMVIWSSFLLDELAGLRADALPTCPSCRDNPRFLAEHSGIITAIRGNGGAQPVQFGEMTSWAVTANAKTRLSQRFVKYMMSDAYLRWIGFAPEGKIPARHGTERDPQAYMRAWQRLKIGVDRRVPFNRVYSPQVLEALRRGANGMDRWGADRHARVLAGAILGELPVPKAITALSNGQSAGKVAERAAREVESIQDSLR